MCVCFGSNLLVLQLEVVTSDVRFSENVHC